MSAKPWNPFPGLRPFEPEEDHLFFGRERDTDELLRQLRSKRFLAVVGTSGCGKSSLVRCGLIPSLQSGLMSHAGSTWRIATMRPGGDPIGQLAVALNAPDVLGATSGELASTGRVMLDASLRRGTLGLVDAIREAQIPPDDHVLIVVDQFEELFRFRRVRPDGPDEAVAFVKLLLEATAQRTTPIYVVITMRSDFIGECMEVPGLPEALNGGQYLVPRLTRDQLRRAITGPVAVANATIAARLVTRLLNDLGDNQDELPVLQHALMRTWDHWAARGQPNEPLDLGDYEAIGSLAEALSAHADETYAEAGPHDPPDVTERIFRALTDTYSDPRGIRRPTSVAELAEICGASEGAVIRVVDIFRRPGRSFLTPPTPAPLNLDTIVDVSHESLMRSWRRLVSWARDEREAADLYLRLANAATYHARGEAGLWGDVEVQLGTRWREHNQPTAAWARRYDPSFDRAMRFLELSRAERAAERSARHALRVRRLIYAWGTAGLLAVAVLIMGYEAHTASQQKRRAEESQRSARDAVDQMLLVTVPDPADLGADAPQVQEFRRALITKAQTFYGILTGGQLPSDTVQSEFANAHYQLGLINRALELPKDAIDQFNAAIGQYDDLIRRTPADASLKKAQADAYSWLGITLTEAKRPSDAALAYHEALLIQTALVQHAPANATYQQVLARTYYNQGILSAESEPDQRSFQAAETNFREALKRLDALNAATPSPSIAQDLARASNNLASLLDRVEARRPEVGPLYQKAIDLHEALVARQPENREFKVELAKFSDNFAYYLQALGRNAEAEKHNSRALDLLDDLSQPVPSTGIEHADGHTLQGRILESRNGQAAIAAYQEALRLFVDLARASNAAGQPYFHRRYGDLLNQLAWQPEGRRSTNRSTLLDTAVTSYAEIGSRALTDGHPEQAQQVIATLSEALRYMSVRDRANATRTLEDLKAKVQKRGPSAPPLA